MQLHGQSIKKKFVRKKLNNYEYGVNMKKPLIFVLSDQFSSFLIVAFNCYFKHVIAAIYAFANMYDY